MGDTIIEKMNVAYQETNYELLSMVNELIQFPINMTIQRFPNKNQKVERDEFIKKCYPHSSEMFIKFCDDHFDGKIHPTDQKS